MILLHEPRLIFLKPHKVAGTSFELALSKFAGPRDIVSPNGAEGARIRSELNLPQPRNFRYRWSKLPFVGLKQWRLAKRRGRIPYRYPAHISAAQLRDRLGSQKWSEFKKVSIVRNPYDVAVSTYYWSRREGQSFGEFWHGNLLLLRRNLIKYHIDGKNVIDQYLRYENLADDVRTLEKSYPSLTGLSEMFSQLHVHSGYRPDGIIPSDLLADEPLIRQAIEETCAFEIERFGYTLG